MAIPIFNDFGEHLLALQGDFDANGEMELLVANQGDALVQEFPLDTLLPPRDTSNGPDLFPGLLSESSFSLAAEALTGVILSATAVLSEPDAGSDASAGGGGPLAPAAGSPDIYTSVGQLLRNVNQWARGASDWLGDAMGPDVSGTVSKFLDEAQQVLLPLLPGGSLIRGILGAGGRHQAGLAPAAVDAVFGEDSWNSTADGPTSDLWGGGLVERWSDDTRLAPDDAASTSDSESFSLGDPLAAANSIGSIPTGAACNWLPFLDPGCIPADPRQRPAILSFLAIPLAADASDDPAQSSQEFGICLSDADRRNGP